MSRLRSLARNIVSMPDSSEIPKSSTVRQRSVKDSNFSTDIVGVYSAPPPRQSTDAVKFLVVAPAFVGFIVLFLVLVFGGGDSKAHVSPPAQASQEDQAKAAAVVSQETAPSSASDLGSQATTHSSGGDVGNPFFDGESLATVYLANISRADHLQMSAAQVRNSTCEQKFDNKSKIAECKAGFDWVIANPTKTVQAPS